MKTFFVNRLSLGFSARFRVGTTMSVCFVLCLFKLNDLGTEDLTCWGVTHPKLPPNPKLPLNPKP